MTGGRRTNNVVLVGVDPLQRGEFGGTFCCGFAHRPQPYLPRDKWAEQVQLFGWDDSQKYAFRIVMLFTADVLRVNMIRDTAVKQLRIIASGLNPWSRFSEALSRFISEAA